MKETTDQTEMPTPRTDAHIVEVCEKLGGYAPIHTWTKATFARQLERELSTATAKLADAERNRCEHCGAKLYSGPPDCPTCGAPNCCPQCCKINQLTHELADAHPQGAEMRAAIQLCSDYIYASDAQMTRGEAPHVDKVGAAIEQALSSDCDQRPGTLKQACGPDKPASGE